MIRISIGILMLLLSIGNKLQGQTCTNDTTFSDILFVIDNSMSIDETEYLSFEQIILNTIQKVQSKCDQSRIAVVHYGGPQGDSTTIEYAFSSNNVISSIERQYCITPGCDGGDDLNKAMSNILGYFGDGSLNRDAENDLSIVIFTDANGSLTNCGPFINCSVIVPYTNIDILKSAPYNADVTVVGVSTEANQSALAVYASPGGNYVGALRSPDCGTSFDGCDTPRKYVQVEFNDDVNITSDSIVGFVECSFSINSGLAVTTSADTTICVNFNGRATMMAQAISGQAPFTYEWDNLLGFGDTKTVNPTTTTTYTVTVTDANNCQVVESITVNADNTCCDPNFTVDINGNLTFCENLGDEATITASTSFGTKPISYNWNNGLSSDSSISVSPAVATTYTVVATDAANCTVTDSVIVTPINCANCTAFAGYPAETLKLCPTNGAYGLNSDLNMGISVPSGYEVIYILTNRDLTIIDYSIGPRMFNVQDEGLYRVHTLVAEVNDLSSPDYLDLSIINLNQSDLFVIVNCLIDHGICADFDFAGRPFLTLSGEDRQCITVENSINLCSDGIDNDGDGLVDCMDPECQDFSICAEASFLACNDLYDNDNDGLVDCDDPDCFQFNICFEQEENCSDGIDNDGDGLIDCLDDSCFNSNRCFENSPATCVDGIDNDRDGLIDCQESSCQRFIVCSEYSVEACTDGLDNDFDGLIDCQDRDCKQILNDLCADNESTLALCGDGIDNDGDGLMDCDDPDCGFNALRALEENVNSNINVTNASCPFNNNGRIELIGELTNQNYQISLNGQVRNGSTFFDLDSGAYTIEIMTLTGCILSTQINISGDDCTELCSDGIDNDGDGLTDCDDPDCGVTDLTNAITFTNPTCPSNDNGTITINGLSTEFTYEFSSNGGESFQSSGLFNNLGAGQYDMVIMANGVCSYTQVVTLTDEVCFEICNNGIDDDNDGLTDCEDNECNLLDFDGQISSTMATCPAFDNSTITISGQVDEIPYRYSIDNGQNFQIEPIFENVSQGEYNVVINIQGQSCEYNTVVVVEAIFCEEICGDGIDNDGDGFTDCEDPHCGLTGILDDITFTEPTCPSSDNGTINISGQLGGIEYSYSIDGGQTFDSSSNFDGLTPGEYNVIVRTSDNCSYESTIILQEAICGEICDNGIDDDGDGLVDCDDGDCGVLGFEGNIITLNSTCESESSGEIIIEGGVDSIQYAYSIDAGQTSQESNVFNGLSEGSYFVIVTTSDGCEYRDQVVIEKEECTQLEICDNGTDDDGDGLIDCDDGDCGLDIGQFMIDVIDPSCPDNNNGVISVATNQNLDGLAYSLDNGATFQDTNVFNGLTVETGSGTQMFSLVIENSFGCSVIIEVPLTGSDCTATDETANEICNNGIDDDNDGLIDCDDDECNDIMPVDPVIVNATCPDNDNGAIIYDGPSDGLLFSLDGENYQELALFDSLNAGTYDLYIQNSNGCDEVMTIIIQPEDDCTETSEFFSEIDLNLTVMLQGAYSPVNGLMTTHLNKLGYLPGQKPTTFFGRAAEAGQPYNEAPWFYEGTEGMSMKDDGKSNEEFYSSDVVDWVLVSFRSESTKSTQFWQGAALLHSDGYIEILNKPSTELVVDIKEFYVVIEHRNHLPVMTPYKLSISEGAISYDFSKSDSFTSIIGVGQVEIYDGTFVMAAGNGDIITEISSYIDINVRDLTSWLEENGSNSSYFNEDYDLNGDINIKDRILWEQNNGIFSSIPNR